jgi:hypothetical protein
MQITLDVPNELRDQIEQYRDRLPEILTIGLYSVLHEGQAHYDEANKIIALLASHPYPEKGLALQPSPALQERLDELLQQSKNGRLSQKDEAELERYLALEHLVRLAKAQAYKEHMKRQK